MSRRGFFSRLFRRHRVATPETGSAKNRRERRDSPRGAPPPDPLAEPTPGDEPQETSTEPWYRQSGPIFEESFADAPGVQGPTPDVAAPTEQPEIAPPAPPVPSSVGGGDPAFRATRPSVEMPSSVPMIRRIEPVEHDVEQTESSADLESGDAEIEPSPPETAAESEPPTILPVRGYYLTRTHDTLRSVAAQFLNAPERWTELRALNAAYPGVAGADPDTLLPEGTALALPGDPLPWGRPDPVYLWTLAETFLYTAWGREPTPEEVVPFWRGLTHGALPSGEAPEPPAALPGVGAIAARNPVGTEELPAELFSGPLEAYEMPAVGLPDDVAGDDAPAEIPADEIVEPAETASADDGDQTGVPAIEAVDETAAAAELIDDTDTTSDSAAAEELDDAEQAEFDVLLLDEEPEAPDTSDDDGDSVFAIEVEPLDGDEAIPVDTEVEEPVTVRTIEFEHLGTDPAEVGDDVDVEVASESPASDELVEYDSSELVAEPFDIQSETAETLAVDDAWSAEPLGIESEPEQEATFESQFLPSPPGFEPPPGLEPPPGFEPPPGLEPPPGFEPPPGLEPPPGFEPPPGLEPPPGFEPPPGLEPPPGFEPPPGLEPPPGFEPPPGLEPPPGFEPPPGLEPPPGFEPPPGLEPPPGFEPPPGLEPPPGFEPPPGLEPPPGFEPPPGLEPPPGFEPPPGLEPPPPKPGLEPPPIFEEWPAEPPAGFDSSAPYAGIPTVDHGGVAPLPPEAEAPSAPRFLPSVTSTVPGHYAPSARTTAVGRSLAGTAVGDAMMLWQLARRRRQGRRGDLAPGPLEQSLMSSGGDESLALIEAAMRHLMAVTVGQGRRMPRVLAVRVGTYGFEVLLQQPVETPPGWRAASGGYVLELPPGVTARDLDAIGRGPSLCPALVPVGNTYEGPLLLNLDELGCLAVSGPSGPASSLLAAIVTTLGSSPMAGDLRITAVGFDAASGMIGWERVQFSRFDDPSLERMLLTTTRLDEGVSELLVIGPGNDLLIQRASQTAIAEGSRLSLVGATSTVSTRWPWRIHVDDTATAVVHPIACTMTAAQALPPEVLAQLGSEWIGGQDAAGSR